MRNLQSGATYKTLFVIFIILGCSNLGIFGQSSNTKLAGEPPSATNSKAKEPSKSSIPQNTPNYSPEDYPASPPAKLPPTVDYLKEAERFQREMESASRKQTNDIQRQSEQIQRESQVERERQQDLQNQIGQQQNDRSNGMVEQQRERTFESRKQEEAAKKIEAEKWKWVWLIPLFEILQIIGLALIAFKYQVAKKSVMAMMVGFVVCLFLYLIMITKLKIDISLSDLF